MQVDNPLQDAAYPVMITSPNMQSSYGLMATAVAAAATAAIPKPAALCLRLSLWRSRPGGVICVERLEVQSAPLLLEVEQTHAMQLMQVGKSMLAPLTDDAAPAIRYPQQCRVVRFSCGRREGDMPTHRGNGCLTPSATGETTVHIPHIISWQASM